MQGVHLLIDGCADACQPLVDLERGKLFLSHVAKAIGMTMMLEPQGVHFPYTKPDGIMKEEVGRASDGTVGGYSAFVLLAESHISIHTYPEACRFSIDCYSCKAFDPAPVFELLKDYFGDLKCTSSMVERGIERHHNVLKRLG